jgi:alkanesulfonate monooxygenase SsuD/methylene tetrahydromethanopterin reductase-like flavin-dependent oxidoreductase (luciferase family)
MVNVSEINRRRGPGIPTARNLDHVAITVPDLEQAVTFFVEWLGASLLYVEGPIRRGPWMVENLAVPADAECRVALLRFGPTANLELFEYATADQRVQGPRNSDVGGHHLALFVDDIQAAHTYVSGIRGVEVLGEPKLIMEGPLVGDRWVYFRTPWGLQLELISLPAHLPYEDGTSERRYGPHHGRWCDAHFPQAHDGPDEESLAVGVALPTNRVRLCGESLLNIVRNLEEARCRSVWTNDHLMTFPRGADAYPYSDDGDVDWEPSHPQYEALTICGYLAACAPRMRIGTAVLVLPQRHPLAVAKAGATLADLTRGRFTLGLGVGWSKHELRALGCDPAQRAARMEEGIRILRFAWGQDDVLPVTRHFDLPPDAILEPRPLPGEAPALLLGGVSRAAIERVRTHGDGWLAAGRIGRPELDALDETWARLRGAVHRPLRGVVKIAVDRPDSPLLPALVNRAQGAGWDELILEFDKWDDDDVVAAVQRCHESRDGSP